jgi:hypothetical protein
MTLPNTGPENTGTSGANVRVDRRVGRHRLLRQEKKWKRNTRHPSLSGTILGSGVTVGRRAPLDSPAAAGASLKLRVFPPSPG